jgi:hypothetical protein
MQANVMLARGQECLVSCMSLHVHVRCAIINQVSNVHASTHARQGGLQHTSTQDAAVPDPAGADFPAAHCTDSQTHQDLKLHARQDDAQLLGQPALDACKPRHSSRQDTCAIKA